MAVGEQYPPDWDERRRDVYQRDDYECQHFECDAKGGPKGDAELHAHHVTPISEGGSHDKENLVTLCKSCHNDQHDHDITAGEQVESGDTIEVEWGTGVFWQWFGYPLIGLLAYLFVTYLIIDVVIGLLGLSGFIGEVIVLSLLLLCAAFAAVINICRRWVLTILAPYNAWVGINLYNGATIDRFVTTWSETFYTVGTGLFAGSTAGEILYLHLHLPLVLWLIGRTIEYLLRHFGEINLGLFGWTITLPSDE